MFTVFAVADCSFGVFERYGEQPNVDTRPVGVAGRVSSL